MLGEAGTKKLTLLKMPDGTGLEKPFSTQYLRRSWHEKAHFTENDRRDWYKKSSLTQNVIWGLLYYLFSMKMLDGVNIKNLLNSISYAGLAQKSSFR